MPEINKTTVGVAVVAGALGVNYINKKMNQEPGREPWDPRVDSQVHYDYVILGGGTAGCVLAARLAEDPNINVLVLEAGYTDDINASKTPAMMSTLWRTDVDWNLRTVPQVHAFGRVMDQPRGKLLGGSSSINAMMYHRGAASDYDEWELLGNPGWSYKECLHYFKKSEGLNDPRLPASHPQGPLTNRTKKPQYEEFEPEFHGTDGPWQITYHHMFGVSESFVRANMAIGVPFNKDFNGTSTIGVNRVQTFLQRNAVRSSLSRAFLSPKENVPGGGARGRIRIVYGAHIARILVQKRRGVKIAIGAEFLDENHVMHKVMAVKEVLLSAGAFGSPHILMASGISPEPHPTIPHIHTLAGVGRNLADHLGVPVNFRALPHCHTFDSEARFYRIPKLVYDYRVHGIGPLSSQGAESVCFVRLEDVSPEFVAREKANGTWQDRSSGPLAPHFEVLLAPSYFRHHTKTKAPDNGNYFTLVGLLLNPVSSGRVKISEVQDGKIQTLIDPNYFEDEFDTRVMAEMVRFIRRIGQQMRQDSTCGAVEAYPGVDSVPNDDDVKLQEYVKRESSVYYHPTSTCRMGPSSDSLAVVDARLNVYGIDRLRVVDASIMPKVPAAHTCAPTVMIAEKAADMIKEDWKDVVNSSKDPTIAKL
ncbi:hypothetical protein BG011_006062 [Mortierella polycephala]|uniref:Glucose-methanol-choline oxidoreductase N-terminal domain-containing protein n=1 Tax=Mortierella polycephala TaxID=41804 RepID=A0A9P6U907_9FUNG|nr:hypothetical protein BG011_006062 [Mortierella polycephala]